jgi:hypothetical protein
VRTTKERIPRATLNVGQQAVCDNNISLAHRFIFQTSKTHNQISISIRNYLHNFVSVLLLISVKWPDYLSVTHNCPRIGQHTEAQCPWAFVIEHNDIYLIHKSERNVGISVINHFCSFRRVKLRQRKNETIFKRKDEFRDTSTYITLLVWGWLVLQCITWPI